MRIRAGIVLVFLLFITTKTAFAQSGMTVTIGGHYWYAQPDYRGEAFEGVEVSSGNMVGPYLNLRVGKFVFGTSMFFGKFNWNNSVYDHKLDISRTDLNFSVGYLIFPRFTVFGAVKSISQNGEKDFTYNGDAFSTNSIVENKGMLYGGGISGILPFVRSPLFLFWSAAYLTGKIEWTKSISTDDQKFGEYENKYDTNITALTVGLGFQASSGLTIMVGYRTDFSGEDEGEERIHGAMATVAYTAR